MMDLNMTESPVGERIAHQWYLRPVLFVSDLQAALRFYIDMLGFEKRWHSTDGEGTVCRVDRGGAKSSCARPPLARIRGRLFVELNRDGIDELRREIAERSLPTEKAWRGYDVIRIADPDGNELLFPLDETNDRERQA